MGFDPLQRYEFDLGALYDGSTVIAQLPCAVCIWQTLSCKVLSWFYKLKLFNYLQEKILSVGKRVQLLCIPKMYEDYEKIP